MNDHERMKLIARYKEGFKEVSSALEGITPGELDFRISPPKWTCREVIHHLADSESIAGERLRRIVVESSPYIRGFDQDEFAKRLQYSKRPHEPALAAFKAARETTLEVMALMTQADWKRSGEHSDSGPLSAERWLEIYSGHAHGHAEQIRKNRAAFKK